MVDRSPHPQITSFDIVTSVFFGAGTREEMHEQDLSLGDMGRH
jgi:hypothetical protein